MSRPTLNTVAQHLGLSAMTVSHALRGLGRVAPETRQKILQKAQELGYRTNSSARITRTGRHDAIGLLNSRDVSQSFLPMPLLWGIQDRMEANELALILAEAPFQKKLSENHVASPRLMREWMVDGLLLNYGIKVSPLFQKELTATGLPAVWINNKKQSNSAYPDDFSATQKAAEMFLQERFRSFGYVDIIDASKQQLAEPPRHYSVKDRPEGFAQALAKERLNFEFMPFDVSTNTRDHVAIARAWLQKMPKPLAVIAISHISASTLLAAAFLERLRIPQDIHIRVLDKEPFSDLGYNLDTYLIPFQNVGRTAVDLLFELIKTKKKSVPSIAVPYTFWNGQGEKPL